MKEKLMNYAKIIQNQTSADDYEIMTTASESQDTRFAQNSITQHIAGDYTNVYFKCMKDQKVGSYSTRQIDEKSLPLIVQKAEEIARNNSPDLEYPPTLSREEYPEIKTYFPSIEKLDTAKMIDIIKICIDTAEKKEAKLSGILSKSIYHYAYLTKRGFIGYGHHSDVDISMTLSSGHIETNVAYGHKDFNKLNIDNILTQLTDQFTALSTMKNMEYETIPVILRPQAVNQLFMYSLWFGFDRKLADQGMTPFTGLLGTKCLGEKLNFRSSINDPELPTVPFTSNSVSKDIDWVKNGILTNLRTPRDWAFKHSLTPCMPYNVIIDGENLSELEMMKKVKRGLIVNNLWYIRLNDMKTSDFTGMTRDGVIYFEDGQYQYAVNNFRFNEQFLDLTKRILATGKSTQLDNRSKVPPMLIDNFNFVDKTTF